MHGSTVKTRKKGKTITTTVERKSMSYVGNDRTLSVHFRYHVVYSFDHV